jgi:hypothetical protein
MSYDTTIVLTERQKPKEFINSADRYAKALDGWHKAKTELAEAKELHQREKQEYYRKYDLQANKPHKQKYR